MCHSVLSVGRIGAVLLLSCKCLMTTGSRRPVQVLSRKLLFTREGSFEMRGKRAARRLGEPSRQPKAYQKVKVEDTRTVSEVGSGVRDRKNWAQL